MVTNKLNISDDLQLPTEAVTQTFAILAQRRKGKTYTANVMAEEMVEAGIPWVALDPTGAWWGLRSSANGKKAGLPVYVFGGDHGDLPLERTAGKMIADLVVEHPGWYVLDFSHFESKAAERELATDFAERFYRRKGVNKAPMHLFVDEADMFAPQRTPAGDQRMLGAFESIVRRGGIRGIGTTLITQRAAVLNKNVLEQIDVLIALRTVGPNDRKAIAGYVEAFATSEQQTELMGSIASLELGEAWVWEPGNDLFKRIKIRKRRTFNSSATPKTGDVPQEIVTLAKVDLEKVRDQMAATIEQVKANDPKELKQQIVDLKRQLADRGTQVEIREKIVKVVPEDLMNSIKKATHSITVEANQLQAVLAQYTDKYEGFDRTEPKNVELTSIDERPGDGQHDDMVSESEPAGDRLLTKAARTILNVSAQFPEGRTKSQLSLLSGYTIKSSSFTKALSELRTAGYISPGHPIVPTKAGLEAADSIERAPTGRALIDYWLNRLGLAERVILNVLIEQYPKALDYQTIADLSTYSRTSSSFTKALSKLRSLDLAEGYGTMKANDTFFEEG